MKVAEVCMLIRPISPCDRAGVILSIFSVNEDIGKYYPQQLKQIIPWEFQTTVTITFPTDNKLFPFFVAGLPYEVHCCDCTLVSDLYKSIYVLSIEKDTKISFDCTVSKNNMRWFRGCACCPELANTALISYLAYFQLVDCQYEK